MMTPSLLLLVSLFTQAYASNVLNSTSYLQATWWPTSYKAGSQASVNDVVSALHTEGVRRIYVDVWNQGVVYFASPTMQNAVGPTGVGNDFLKWVLDAAKVYNIEVFAWFEYGIMTSYGGINNDFARYAQSKGWIIGEYSGFYWMNPDNTAMLNFIVGIMNDAIDGYSLSGLKGVQLDDHFGSPVSLGKSIASMNNAMSYVNKNLRNNSFLSLSPGTLDSALSYNVDWNNWGKLGYFKEVIPQIYRSTYSSFQTEFDYTSTHLNSVTKSLWIASGVRADGSGSPTPWADVNNMIWYCNAKYMGASVWYAHAILELYPSNFVNIWG